MLESVYYENSRGEQVNLRSFSLLANFRSSRPFSYEINNGGYINTGKDFAMLVLASGRRTIDELITLLHKDIVDNNDGKLFVNGWYLFCRYTGLRTVSYESDNFVKVEIFFHADNFLWTRRTLYDFKSQSEFEPQDPLNSGDNYLDMTFDLEHDYKNDGMSLAGLENTEDEPADMIISCTGTGSAFALNISGEGFNNNYIVNAVMNNDELIIDTENKKVTLSGADSIANVPDSSDVFKKIPKGVYLATWSPEADLIIEVLEHRSLPLWEI